MNVHKNSNEVIGFIGVMIIKIFIKIYSVATSCGVLQTPDKASENLQKSSIFLVPNYLERNLGIK